MTIRMAVIGAGLMGADHARIAAEDMPGARLQVVCDMDAARPRLVAEACGSADVARDPAAVIASADVDAVILAEQTAGRRFDQAYVEMKAALDQGRLGRALMMRNIHRNVATPAADFTGAMAITNSAPHEFDEERHVLGCDYAAISAFQPRRSDALVAPVDIRGRIPLTRQKKPDRKAPDHDRSPD